MPRVTGIKAHRARLKRLTSPEQKKRIGQALYVAGQAIQVDAQISITAGAVSGKNHEASKPGEAPNNDTAVLANNIECVQVGPLAVEVSSNAPYAAALEYGTSKMAPRPYMEPAVARNRDTASHLIIDEVRRVAGGRSLGEAQRRSKQEGDHFGGAKGGR